MNYISYTFTIKSDTLSNQISSEILISELGLVGFESFTENKNGVTAYIQKIDWHGDILDEIQLLQSEEVVITYDIEEIEQVNWNSEWEKNFEPIQVDNLVSIRAPFHENPIPMAIGIKYDIVIEPKMSFGTGHHETTHLMIQHLIDLNLKGKRVLDMGCGTGILAIFAEMKGAKKLDAIDIDNWCYENSKENVERNNCENIKVFEGDVSLLKDKKYDIIIANINRNILLKHINVYANCLNQNGVLLLSGFYTEDISVIEKEANSYSLKLEKKLERNNWVGLKFVIL
ncbi:MAG: 50S ribosomal protein L11 methyltransferase [Flavobacteriaceae bacterium]|nr:50S ribosomal protein L11 methyltransferase [Flavobacteriaceae bacterium]